jgi:glycosyltransferase involved in cell wall biosynthesis
VNESHFELCEMSKVVSLVIPSYNHALTVNLALSSCVQQTHKNCEIIVIDDGSTDTSLTSLNEFKLKHHHIRVVSIVHSGVASAFNRGIEEAAGDYIARMDADDVMHPEKIAKQVKFLDENPEVGVVSCLVQHGGNRETQEGYARHIDWINSLVTHEQISLNRFIDSPVCNPTVMFRKELVNRHGAALEGNFPEDYEMWLRWMDAGVRFEKIPEVLFTWNDLPTRLTRNDERYSPDAFGRAKIQYLVKFIKQNNPTGRPLYVCGGGRITRKKSKLLIESGIDIGAYVDIDPARVGSEIDGVLVIALSDLPPKESAYVVNFVSVRGAREELQKLLESKGFEHGPDYISAG